MRLKVGWFKGPLDFQFVTTIGEFRLFSGSFFYPRWKINSLPPCKPFPLCRERNLTEISLAVVPDTVEKDTAGAVW